MSNVQICISLDIIARRLQIGTWLPGPKYCPGAGLSSENDRSPLRFGESLDFSLSFCGRDLLAWPTALQIGLKNNTESALFELPPDVCSKRFQANILAIQSTIVRISLDRVKKSTKRFGMYRVRY